MLRLVVTHFSLFTNYFCSPSIDYHGGEDGGIGGTPSALPVGQFFIKRLKLFRFFTSSLF